ncbi:MAG: hypothetical protein AAF563_00510 [Pseudomonadota bacterium]
MILKFGHRYGYDVGYMLHMLETTPDVMGSFNALSKLAGYRKAVPVNAHMAAGLRGVLYEDCGPCVQLTVDMAREAGVASDQIEAVLTGDLAIMSSDTALGYRFASAILARSSDDEAAREAVRGAYGDAGVIALTLAAQVSRVFPMVKTGLGYGKTCSRVHVGERQVSPMKEAA